MTTLKFSRSAGGLFTESLKNRYLSCPPLVEGRAKASLSHVTLASQLFETVFAVLQPARALGDILELSALQFRDDVVDVLRRAVDRILARPAAKAAVSLAVALVVVQRHGRDRLALDVLPDVEL